MMVITQIQITEEQWKYLKRLCAQKNVSLAELVRQALDILLKSSKHLDRQELWKRAMEAVGGFQSGKGDISRNHDKYLAETIDS